MREYNAKRYKETIKRVMQTYGKRLLIILAISLAAAMLMELFWNRQTLQMDKTDRGMISVPLENLYTEGFEARDGKLILTGQPAIIRIDQPCSYVRKLEYAFAYPYDFVAVARICPTADAEATQSFIDIADGNNRLLTVSEVSIDASFDHVDLIFPEGTEGLEILSVNYDNSVHVSGRRILATATALLLILWILSCPSILENRLEYAFLWIGMTACVTIVFTFPAQKVSWDEAYHFRHAYELGLGTRIILSPEVQYYGSDDEVASLLYPTTMQEFNNLEQGLDRSAIYDPDASGNQVIRSGFASFNDIGHIPCAIGISFARLLHLPLAAVYKCGRLFNAWFYLLLTWLAIRRAKIGKQLLTAIALMPTLLFLASSYSYDASLNACAFLGLSYVLSELVERNTPITWRRYLIIIGSLFFASGVKLLYAPLLLLVLLLPRQKFRDKKTVYLMKGGVLLVCVLLLAVMMLPTLLNPVGVEADARGGATSTGGQLSVIFGNPIGYAKLLLMSVLSSAVDFTIGNGIFGTMAHYGYVPFGGFITVLMVFLTLTDVAKDTLRIRERVVILGLVGIIVAFIWTAMYISFTPVGAASINGVQGRYFVPILLPLLLALQTTHIENHIPRAVYHRIVVGVPMLLTYSVILYKVFVNAS